MDSLQTRAEAITLAAFSDLEPTMGADFSSTMTEADFKRPLLDAAEARLAREARGDTDLSVEGLADSLLAKLIRLFSGLRAPRS